MTAVQLTIDHAHRPAWQLPRPATRRVCPGAHGAPIRARHGYRCSRCPAWWLGGLVAAVGHIPTHTIPIEEI